MMMILLIMTKQSDILITIIMVIMIKTVVMVKIGQQCGQEVELSQASLALYSLYQAIYSNIHVCISGICSTDEIEWNRNGDGVIDFYPLHFLFPASE